MITYGSVCSGIEAASCAWHPLGWRAEWFAEIEPFPSAVLAHRWPEVTNHGDMTLLAAKVLAGTISTPDVLVGGTPCQAFSVAGMRQGLLDPRGALTIKYVELADAIDHVRARAGQPAVVTAWENVPGVLSDKGNAFGCFLGALAGEDCELQPAGKRWTDAGCVYGPKRTIAWRVLDAQYFGLAQRRRRVFVVASARAGFDPAAVLFEREGVRRDTAPRRGEGQDLAGTAGSGAAFGGNNQRGAIDVATACRAKGGSGHGDFDSETFVVSGTLQANGKAAGSATQQDAEAGLLVVHGTQDPDIQLDQAHPLGRNHGQENAIFAIQAGALRTNPLSGPDGAGVQADHAYTLEARAEVQVVAFAQNSRDEVRLMGGDGQIIGALAAEAGMKQQCYVAQCVTGDITHTLKADGFDGFDGSEDGTGRGQPIVACAPIGCDGTIDGPVPPLMARSSRGGAQTLSPGHQTDGHMVKVSSAVRRLTPAECEKLQGFKPGYTLIPWRGKPAEECPDGPRYKAIGNSKAVPVVRWIGQRIHQQLEKTR